MSGGSFCVARFAAIALIILLLFACGHGQRTLFAPGLDAAKPAAPIALAEVTWPTTLPADALQPWEQMDGSGRVASSINLDSQFVPGVERFSEAGDVADLGEAASFASGTPSAEAVSYALYRIPLGSDQPGTIAADVNLHNGGAYYLGVADYSADTWRWHGPFAAPHVRVSLPHYEYTSTLGNLFVAVVAYDGASFDLVGLGVNARDDADSSAPEAPEAPTLTPVAGGLHVRWLQVDEEDLAGYRVYADGDEALNYVEGGTSVVIPATAETEITLTAIDLSGNESDPSEASSDSPLAGAIPALEITASAASGGRNAVIELTASGAETYDWDVDGDGNYDITGDATGSATASTASFGIIRPALRGHTADGGFSLSAVSLIIAGNSRPVALATADVYSGPAPLTVNFTITGEDEDGAIAWYSCDFDGDGTFDDSTPANPSPREFVYAADGVYNAKFRVTDDEDAWDVDTVTIVVMANLPPVAIVGVEQLKLYLGETGFGTVTFDASGSYDPDGTAALTFSIDPYGDNYSIYNGYDPIIPFDYSVSGLFNASVWVSEVPSGLFDVASFLVRIYRFGSAAIDSAGNVGMYTSLAVVNGYPAICYNDDTNGDLKYVRASDASGSSWGTAVTVDSAGWVGYFTSLAIVNGNPAISYNDATNNDLKYVRASDADGSSWGTPLTLDSAGNVGNYTSLAVVNGNPAISYSNWSNGALRYVRASDADGSSWGTPVTVDSAGSTNAYSSLAVVFGNPAISYYDDTNDDLRYVRASDADGSSWGAPIEIDSDGSVGQYSSLAVVNEYPVISYNDATNGDLKYVHASSVNGGQWRDPVTVDSAGWVGYYTSMTIVNGNPAISYYDNANGDLKFAYPRLD